MFNFVIAGNVKNSSLANIDIKFDITYKDSNISVSNLSSINSTYIINTGDSNHLGISNKLEIGSPIYIRSRYYAIDNYTVLINSYKRFNYTGNPVLIKDLILDNSINISLTLANTKVDNSYTFKPTVNTSNTIKETVYYIYHDINQISTEPTTTSNFKLLKTITKSNLSDLIILFNKSGTYKIACEVMVDQNEVSELSENIININTTTITTVGNNQRYIEWE